MISISMHKRAGLIFLCKKTERILLILENQKWSVPTFVRGGTLLDDISPILTSFSQGKIIPIELYLSEDQGFEYGTYVCLVEEEFNITTFDTICWAKIESLPSNLHHGLKSTLNNKVIQSKIETILNIQ